ncbi:MAG: glycosyltransferase [Lachnospiraceae bacterium]|nr:glycosyltransferase [Lachnospiraceae bacterium]
MEEIKISVVVAVYNAKEYLEKCIKSICGQTWKNLEILLVDDGSTDGSGELCDILAQQDARIHVIHQKNCGVSETRNAGIRRSTGRYIAFVDSDDYLEKEYVEMLVDQSCLDSMAIVGYYIDIEKEGIIRKRPVTAGKELIRILDERQVAKIYQLGLFSVVWNKLYETKILKDGVFFEKGISLGEDLIFNLNYMSRKGREYRIVNRPLYHYVRRGIDSLDTKYRTDFSACQQLIFERFIEYVTRIGAERKDIDILYECYFRALIVAIDNLYSNRSQLEKKKYHKDFCELAQNSKLDWIIKQLRGKKRMVCGMRLWGIRHGLYCFDYAGRESIKHIMRMK